MNEEQTLEQNKGKGIMDLVFEHIRKILELSRTELRQSVTIKTNATGDRTEINEDTRVSFVQAIESLGLVLTPFFDERMKKSWHTDGKVMGLYNYQLETRFKKEFAKHLELSEEDRMDNDFYQGIRMHYAKSLFLQLNLLLKRLDYLKDVDFGNNE